MAIDLPSADASGSRVPDLRAQALTLLTILIWSGNTIVTKASAGVIAPASISFYRWLIALILLSPFVAAGLWNNRLMLRRHIAKLAVLGLLGMVIYQSLAYEAARTTSAINMGMLVALMPLIAILCAAALAAERLTWASIAGGMLSLVGAAYLIARGDPALLLSGGLHVGDALMLVAVVANALYGVLLKRWALPLPMWQQLWCQIAVATLVLFPLWLMSDISPVTTTSLPLILYAAIPTSLLAPYCWMIGVQRLGAARSSLYINLFPFLVVILAWALLGERLELHHLIGGGLALVGVAIGSHRPKRAALAAKPAATRRSGDEGSAAP